MQPYNLQGFGANALGIMQLDIDRVLDCRLQSPDSPERTLHIPPFPRNLPGVDCLTQNSSAADQQKASPSPSS